MTVLKWQWRLLAGLALLVLAIFLLAIPEAEVEPVQPATAEPFVWNQDELWNRLEARFDLTRSLGCKTLGSALDTALLNAETRLSTLRAGPIAVTDPVLDAVESDVFFLAPLLAPCPTALPRFLSLTNGLRDAVKEQSRAWDAGAHATRARLYRLLYGRRAALEEAILQAPPGSAALPVLCHDEPSATPAIEVHGVEVHSGDILVSRGDAPTSAIIARGSDFPGNFSHVALVHVDATSHAASVIEALIEHGVVVNSADAYLADPKLRIMLLRLRADTPAMRANPMLPHEVATAARAHALEHRIPYDFAMDPVDHARMFCSEVAAAAYEEQGVRLWPGLSTISSPGVAQWLAVFGVRRLQTLEPTDLEYDPQLTVVAEWRDPDALFRDHVDNAVTDVLLETARADVPLAYDRALLPLVRLAKAWSLLLATIGLDGPIPDGMSATAALKHRALVARHAEIEARLLEAARAFEEAHGYRPPYWELVKLARQARDVRLP